MKEFYEVDSENDDPIEMQEAAAFFSKMDYEGGMEGLYMYGGEGAFPEEVRSEAQAFGRAFENLSSALTSWGESRGVRY